MIDISDHYHLELKKEEIFDCFMLLYTPSDAKQVDKKKNWKKQLTAFLPIVYHYFSITYQLQNPARFA